MYPQSTPTQGSCSRGESGKESTVEFKCLSTRAEVIDELVTISMYQVPCHVQHVLHCYVIVHKGVTLTKDVQLCVLAVHCVMSNLHSDLHLLDSYRAERQLISPLPSK